MKVKTKKRGEVSDNSLKLENIGASLAVGSLLMN
jgi:hypothetical protein